MNEQLAARVAAVNKVNALAADLFDKITSVIRQFVGKKIKKADGELLEKVARLLPKLPNTAMQRAYRMSSDYSLVYSVSIWDGNRHETCTIYIGSISDGVLTSLDGGSDTWRTDWTVEEVVAGRETATRMLEAAEAAKEKIQPFGMDDY